jgi:hypothetical protein
MTTMIHNPNMPNAELRVGFETVVCDGQGNVEIADDDAARRLCETPGWEQGANPEVPQIATPSFGGNPNDVIDKLRTQLIESGEEAQRLATRNTELLVRVGGLQGEIVELKAKLQEAAQAPQAPQTTEDAPEDDDEDEGAPEDDDEGDTNEDDDGDEAVGPDMTWTKKAIVEWATENGYDVDGAGTKGEILESLDQAA